MKKLLFASCIALASCGGKIPENNSLSVTQEETTQISIYIIEGTRECIAGAIGNILTVWCKGSRKIDLEINEFKTIDKECFREPGIRICVFGAPINKLQEIRALNKIELTSTILQ